LILREVPQLPSFGWQITENSAGLATVENKLQFLRWCIAEIYV
jgi:hypothetical protein